jgi:hypothetical protein
MEDRVAGDDRLQVMRNAQGYHRVVAAVAMSEGEGLAPFGARESLSSPNCLTVQTGPDVHILLAPEQLRYINHSCDPNVFFDTARTEICALCPIAPGDEITFFYPSTEWSMDARSPSAAQAAIAWGRLPAPTSSMPGRSPATASTPISLKRWPGGSPLSQRKGNDS